MSETPQFVQVTTSTGGLDEAQHIARLLVEEKLAACAQVVGPIRSTYWWRGAIETAEEYLLFLKTTHAACEHVVKSIRRNHSFDTPEIICTPIVAGDESYLVWLRETVEV